MDPHAVRRPILIAMGTLIVGVVVINLMFAGGQTARILSTVGGPIPDQPAGAAPGAGAATPASEPTAAAGAGGHLADAGATVPTLLIVRTGELSLEISDLAAAVRAGDAAVLRAGGYVSNSSRTADTAGASARVTYRIPSAAWDATLEALRGLAGRVIAEQVRTDEVTGQVVDLTARIANLRATEAALQAIMAKATKISDVLDVQDQLTTTRGRIEELVGQKASLEDRASYGSLDVTFQLPVTPTPKATPAPTKGWDPGTDVAQASGKLVRIGQTTTSIGIWLAIVGLPLAIGGMVALFTGWKLSRVVRWLIGRREAASAAGH